MQGQIATSLPVTNQPNFVGNFNGISLVEDDETGFLTAPDEPLHIGNLRYGNGTSPLSLFTAVKKLQVIEFLRKRWNIARAMASIGLSRQTFNNHYAIDQHFRDCVDEIREGIVDDHEEVRFNVGRTASGSFDRMCVLNAYRAETYNPKTKIEIEHTMQPMEAKRRDGAVDRIVDAEIVETVKRVRKAQRP